MRQYDSLTVGLHLPEVTFSTAKQRLETGPVTQFSHGEMLVAFLVSETGKCLEYGKKGMAFNSVPHSMEHSRTAPIAISVDVVMGTVVLQLPPCAGQKVFQCFPDLARFCLSGCVQFAA